jgi:hypothetical protein
MPNFVLDGSKDPTKQTRARKVRLKQPQYGAGLSSKLTSRSRGIKSRRNIRRETMCKEKMV